MSAGGESGRAHDTIPHATPNRLLELLRRELAHRDVFLDEFDAPIESLFPSNSDADIRSKFNNVNADTRSEVFKDAAGARTAGSPAADAPPLTLQVRLKQVICEMRQSAIGNVTPQLTSANSSNPKPGTTASKNSVVTDMSDSINTGVVDNKMIVENLGTREEGKDGGVSGVGRDEKLGNSSNDNSPGGLERIILPEEMLDASISATTAEETIEVWGISDPLHISKNLVVERSRRRFAMACRILLHWRIYRRRHPVERAGEEKEGKKGEDTETEDENDVKGKTGREKDYKETGNNDIESDDDLHPHWTAGNCSPGSQGGSWSKRRKLINEPDDSDDLVISPATRKQLGLPISGNVNVFHQAESNSGVSGSSGGHAGAGSSSKGDAGSSNISVSSGNVSSKSSESRNFRSGANISVAVIRSSVVEKLNQTQHKENKIFRDDMVQLVSREAEDVVYGDDKWLTIAEVQGGINWIIPQPRIPFSSIMKPFNLLAKSLHSKSKKLQSAKKVAQGLCRAFDPGTEFEDRQLVKFFKKHWTRFPTADEIETALWHAGSPEKTSLSELQLEPSVAYVFAALASKQSLEASDEGDEYVEEIWKEFAGFSMRVQDFEEAVLVLLEFLVRVPHSSSVFCLTREMKDVYCLHYNPVNGPEPWELSNNRENWSPSYLMCVEQSAIDVTAPLSYQARWVSTVLKLITILRQAAANSDENEAAHTLKIFGEGISFMYPAAAGAGDKDCGNRLYGNRCMFCSPEKYYRALFQQIRHGNVDPANLEVGIKIGSDSASDESESSVRVQVIMEKIRALLDNSDEHASNALVTVRQANGSAKSSSSSGGRGDVEISGGNSNSKVDSNGEANLDASIRSALRQFLSCIGNPGRYGLNNADEGDVDRHINRGTNSVETLPNETMIRIQHPLGGEFHFKREGLVEDTNLLVAISSIRDAISVRAIRDAISSKVSRGNHGMLKDVILVNSKTMAELSDYAFISESDVADLEVTICCWQSVSFSSLMKPWNQFAEALNERPRSKTKFSRSILLSGVKRLGEELLSGKESIDRAGTFDPRPLAFFCQRQWGFQRGALGFFPGSYLYRKAVCALGSPAQTSAAELGLHRSAAFVLGGFLATFDEYESAWGVIGWEAPALVWAAQEFSDGVLHLMEFLVELPDAAALFLVPPGVNHLRSTVTNCRFRRQFELQVLGTERPSMFFTILHCVIGSAKFSPAVYRRWMAFALKMITVLRKSKLPAASETLRLFGESIACYLSHELISELPEGLIYGTHCQRCSEIDVRVKLFRHIIYGDVTIEEGLHLWRVNRQDMIAVVRRSRISEDVEYLKKAWEKKYI